jgi:hypothetical protein
MRAVRDSIFFLSLNVSEESVNEVEGRKQAQQTTMMRMMFAALVVALSAASVSAGTDVNVPLQFVKVHQVRHDTRTMERMTL